MKTSSNFSSFLALVAVIAGFFIGTPSYAASSCDRMEDVFEQLDCELRLAQMQLAIKQTRSEMGQLEGTEEALIAGSIDGNARAAGVPTLIRIYGTPDDLAAQFSKGSTVYTVRIGDEVSDGCKLQRIFEGGAAVRCGSGEQVLRLGHAVRAARPQPSAPPASASAAPATATAVAPAIEP